jgi:phosphomevalonate kinase
MRFSASAPGKAVLSGEYAVLQGAPAISMAVDCRARVTVESSGEDFHSVVSPGIASEATFRCTERGRIDWLDDGRTNPDQALLEHVWRAVQVLPSEGLALTLDTRPFFDAESSLKLGFGSSSALAAALTASLAKAGTANAGARAARDIPGAAMRAHSGFQGGMGSGIDVATAISGGVIAYAMRPDQRVKVLSWPDSLKISLMWSGKPASTAERLKKLERFERNRAARTAAAHLVDASSVVLDEWEKGSAAAILDSLRAYTIALRRFSVEHRLGVFDAGHQELCDVAEENGLVYKPSGAGGGDIGVLFAHDDEAIDEFGAHAGQLGFRRLDRGIESAGLTYEH